MGHDTTYTPVSPVDYVDTETEQLFSLLVFSSTVDSNTYEQKLTRTPKLSNPIVII